MSDFKPLLRSSAGINWSVRDEEGLGATYRAQADVTPILEDNQARAGTNNGYTPDRTMRHAATIPLVIIQKWRDEEGWDPMSSDPDCQRKLAQKLDDPAWRYLRTAEFRIGDNFKNAIARR